MNNEIKDFIFSIADFNSCEFCNKFNLRGKCPVKNFYNEEEEPSEEKIKEGGNMCKDFIVKHLKEKLNS